MKKLLAILLLTATGAYSAITVQPSTLGNLFLTTETVSVPVSSSGPITWTVRDYWGSVIASGSGSPIKPGISTPGYYEVTIVDGATTLIAPFGIVTAYAPDPSSRFGVQSHFAQFHSQTVIPLMAKYGFYHLRDDQMWGSVESTKGVYAFPQKFVDYMAKAKAAQISPITCLFPGNKNYDYESGDFTFPWTDNGRLGFANYANAVLAKYPEVKQVEVWSEPNQSSFFKGPGSSDKAGYYTLACKKVYETVKPVNPDVKIIVGSTVPVSHGFFRDCFAKGILPYCDGLSIHPYRNDPDSVDIDIDELQRMTREKNGGVEKPIWATEFSYNTKTEADHYISASYTAQIVALMLKENIARMYYYLIMDDGTFPVRGLVGTASAVAAGALRPHPEAISYANCIRQYNGATFSSRIPSAPSTYALKFMRGSEQMTVLWSNWPVTISVSTTSPLTVTNLMGGTEIKAPIGGKVTLRATKDVQYLVGPVTAVAEVGSLLVADSVSGYSKTVGLNGWSYGYALLTPTAAYSTSAYTPMPWGIWASDHYCWVLGGNLSGEKSLLSPVSTKWAIRRWTSNYAGPVRLEGEINRSAGGDGNGVRFFRDGVEIYNVSVAPSQALSFSIPVNVSVGTKIDFTVNMKGENSYDAMYIVTRVVKDGVIAQPSPPTNLHLTVVGPSAPTNLHLQ
jgi:hypothetical protein